MYKQWRRQPDVQTSWDACVIRGPLEALTLTIQEGVDRLLQSPLDDVHSRIVAAVTAKMGESAGAAMDDLIVVLVDEGARLGGMLAVALATAQMGPHDTFEQWLQNAIDRAQLRDYALDSDWGEFADKIVGK